MKLIHVRDAARGLITVHAAVRDTSVLVARLCRPDVNAVLDAFNRSDSSVITCGNCLRIIAAAERFAHDVQAEITTAEAEAREAVARSIKFGHTAMFASAPDLRISVKLAPGSIRFWMAKGDAAAVGTAVYSLRRAELQLAWLTKQAAAAELEAYEQRDLATRGLRMLETLETLNEGLRKAGRHATVAEKMAAFVELEHGEALEEHRVRFPLDTCECGSGLPSWECELLTAHTA